MTELLVGTGLVLVAGAAVFTAFRLVVTALTEETD